ncbi:MAG: class E sortase [Methanobrevibacter wolinii]|nr:class E sortase [Methanobrevibacter wolinii]
MDKSTIVIIIALLIVGLYAANEVTYFSHKLITENDMNNPVVVCEKIGLHEKINNNSISEGVYHERKSYNPGEGDVILFGHRTLLGSPFLRLNELNPGDIITLQWPGIGEVNYTVYNKTVVPATYRPIISSDTQTLSLITCTPIGTTEKRLIIKANYTSKEPLNQYVIKDNPQSNYGIYIIIGFILLGLIVTFLSPKSERKFIGTCVILITLFLVYCHINPGPVNEFTSKIEFLNQIFTLGIG